ncbi:hypothetical protein EYF80_010004 [Liparis tanakae]|uniref:Uncharacterized protein n=1 Tax=Liparis tanakae TaxID=230148 RepID=A0A4Z2IP29_9TELE|nr:hypothetical protein EYF80_010004 [Liparis tanakae]
MVQEERERESGGDPGGVGAAPQGVILSIQHLKRRWKNTNTVFSDILIQTYEVESSLPSAETVASTLSCGFLGVQHSSSKPQRDHFLMQRRPLPLCIKDTFCGEHTPAYIPSLPSRGLILYHLQGATCSTAIIGMDGTATISRKRRGTGPNNTLVCTRLKISPRSVTVLPCNDVVKSARKEDDSAVTVVVTKWIVALYLPVLERSKPTEMIQSVAPNTQVHMRKHTDITSNAHTGTACGLASQESLSPADKVLNVQRICLSDQPGFKGHQELPLPLSQETSSRKAKGERVERLRGRREVVTNVYAVAVPLQMDLIQSHTTLWTLVGCVGQKLLARHRFPQGETLPPTLTQFLSQKSTCNLRDGHKPPSLSTGVKCDWLQAVFTPTSFHAPTKSSKPTQTHKRYAAPTNSHRSLPLPKKGTQPI